MADAMFSFESNISKVAAEIDQGLARIKASISGADAPATASLLGNLSGQARREVDAAIDHLKRLRAAADQLARSGTGLPQGQRTLNTEMDARIRQLRDALRTQVTAAAQAGGAGLDVEELRRQIDRGVIGPLRRLKRDLMRDIQTVGTPEQQAVYGPRTRPPAPTPPPVRQTRAEDVTPPSAPAEQARRRRPVDPESIGASALRDEAERRRIDDARALAREVDEYIKAHPGGPVRAFNASTYIDERSGQREVLAREHASGGLFRVTDEAYPDFRRSVLRRDDEIQANKKVEAAQREYAQHLVKAGQSIDDLAKTNRIFSEDAITRLGSNVFRDPRGGQTLYSKINTAGEAQPVTSPAEIQRLDTQHVEQVAAARRDLAEILRINAARLARNPDTAGIDDLYAARRAQANELINSAAAERRRVKEDPALAYPTGVRRVNQYIIDPRFGERRAFAPDRPSGGFVEIDKRLQPREYKKALEADDAARGVAEERAARKAQAAEARRVAAEERAARKAQIAEERAARKVQIAEERAASKAYAQHLVSAGQSIDELAKTNRRFIENAITRMGDNIYRDPRGGEVRYSKINAAGEARPITNPDEIQRLETRYTEQVAAARRDLAEILRINTARLALNPDAAGIDELHAARRALANELIDSAAAERRRVREEGLVYPTGVRAVGPGGQYMIDPRFDGDDRVYRRDRDSGGRTEVPVGTPAYREALDLDEKARLAKEASANTAALASHRRQLGQTERAERELERELRTNARRGLTSNFLAGINSSGFGGGGFGDGGGFGGGGGFNGNFDGLARSAGQTVKYAVLYDALYGLQAMAAAAVAQFLDAEDSIVELTLAMGEGSTVAAGFQNELQDVARQGGDNVGLAMDVAASGIRAFRAQAQAAGIDAQEMGAAFARQSKRISILTKTDWTQAANEMKAVANGFKIEPSDTGFATIADAIAGAKLAGGGDESEISKGLAGSALSLAQMGYDLREAATIVSAINAQTAESGQLVATRIARVGSIFGGASGKSYLRELNATLDRLGQERIDLTAPVSEQIQTLANAWNTLPSNIQETTINRLGGTGSPREFQALMESITAISENAAKDEFFNGAAAHELEERLKNVRGVLNQIVGDVTGIVTNLAMSGIAAPFVEVLGLLRFITDHLLKITQMVYSLSKVGQGLIPFAKDLSLGTIIANIAALAAGIKIISAIRQAGGIRGFAAGQEARFMPGRALARQQLATATGATAGLATPTALAATTTPAGRAALRRAAADDFHETSAYAADLRATAAARSFTGTRADTAVHDAARDLSKASGHLDKTVSEIEQRALTGGRGRTITAAEQEQITKARVAQASALGRLEYREQRQGAAGAVNDRFARERDTAERAYVRKYADLTREIAHWGKAGDKDRLKQALNERVALEKGFTSKLRDIETRHLAAQRQLADSVGRSAGFNRFDALTGGVAGRARTAWDTGGDTRTARAGAALRQVGRDAQTGIGRAGSKIGGVVGSELGAIGGVIVAIDIAAQFNSALKSLKNTMGESERVRLQMAQTSADELEKAAQAQLTAAAALEKAQEGFWGSLADWASGGGADEEAERQRNLGRRYQAQADEIRRQMDVAAKRGVTTDELASAVDWTNVDTISESMGKLGEEGHSAAARVDVLIQRIRGLGDVSTSSLGDLSSVDRNRLAIGVGNRADSIIDDVLRVTNQELERLPPRSDPRIASPKESRLEREIDALEGIDRTKFRAATEGAVRSFLDEGGDLESDKGRERYRQLLTEAYQRAGLTPAEYGKLIDQVVENSLTRFRGESKKQSDFSKLKDILTVALEEAPKAAQEAARDVQYDAVAHGKVDTSAGVGVRAGLNVLETAREEAQQQLDAAIAAGTLSDEQIAEAQRDLSTLDNSIKEARVQLWKSLADEARALNQVTERRRRRIIGQTPTLAAARAATRQSNVEQLQPLLGARDTEGLTDWIEGSDSQTVEEQRKFIQDRVNTATKNLDAAKKTSGIRAAQADLERAQTALVTARKTGDQDQVRTAQEDLKRAQAALDAAKKTGDQARIRTAQADLDRAQGEADAFNAALDQAATPGGGGLNAAQLAATQRAAVAARNRDSLAAAKAALDLADENRRLAKNDRETAEADKEYAEAKNAYVDEQIATKNALADINAFDDSRIDTTTRALRDARQNLAKFQKGTKEYAEAMRAVLVAQRAAADAAAELATMRAQLGSDLTNPLQQADIALAAARAKADRDREAVKGLPQDVQDEVNARNELAIRDLLNQREATIHSRANNLSDALLNAGEISKQAWLKAQRAELERIEAQLAGMKETDNGYEQLRNEALEQKARIRDALKSLAGQWNLGDIKVPTPYEVRRSLKTDTENPMLGRVTNVNTTNNVTVNGADFAKVVALLNDYLDSGKRYTTGSRRGA